MKAFAYLRVSDIRQELSPEAQRAQLEAYCIVKGYELAHVFDETSSSALSAGVSLRERPEGSWLMTMLSEVDAVIFAKVDRAFRDTVDCLTTAADIAAAGKTLHFLDLGVDTSTAAGEMCLTFMVGVARFERRRISDRIREALAVVKKQGRKIGPAPFGSRNLARVVDGRKLDGGLHASVADEAPTIARIMEMRRADCTLREIAMALNVAKVPTRRGGKWAPETVRKVIRRTLPSSAIAGMLP